MMQGVFLDAKGHVAEGPNMNIAIISEDGTFIVRLPMLSLHFDGCASAACLPALSAFYSSMRLSHASSCCMLHISM